MDTSLLEILDAKINEYQLDELRPQIIANALECFYMESTEPDDYGDIGNSRLGGLPDLPDTLEWPTTDDDQHLIFLGQINLRDIQGINADLPGQGILYLFLGNEETAYDVESTILYCPDESRARKGELPDAYNPTYEDEDYAENPYRVGFTKHLSLPNYGNDLLESMGVEDEEADHLDAYLEMVNSLTPGDTGSHQIFGHIGYLNDDPRKAAAEKFGRPDWQILLKLGWDKKVGFCFWDAGDLLFLVQKSSLAAGDFTTVFSCIETT
jgi:uncharacterized protein YwqG